MKKFSKLLAMICVCIFLTGCLPEFTSPVVTPEHNELDRRLIGLWTLEAEGPDESDDEYAFLLILPCQNQLCVSYYESDDNEADMTHFKGYAARIDGKGYLNVRPYEDVAEVTYQLVRYEFLEANRFRLAFTESRLIKAAIDDELISGHYEPKPSYSTPTVTSDRATVLEFLKENDVFDKNPEGVFVRREIGM